MRILSFKTGHDPAACLLEGGRVIAAAEEERFVRVKHAADYFPEHAIRFCLEKGKTTLDEVDYIVFAREKNLKTFFKVALYFFTRLPKNMTELRYMKTLFVVQLRGMLDAVFGKAPYQKIFSVIGGKKRKIYSFDHHSCHAASAYYGSGFDEAAVLCMDGKGESTSISMWRGKGGKLEVIRRYGIFDSLGYLYGSITDHLGFRINDGEYKVMGMAPYGKPNTEFDDIFSVSKSGVYINTKYSLYPFSLQNLARRLPNFTQEYNEFTIPEANANLAATLQHRLEKAALWYVKELLSLVKSDNLCLAGGVALNVKMNKIIWESGFVKNLWVQPAAGDMGNVLGAAWLMYFQQKRERPEPLQHLYLGKEYGEKDIESAFAANNLSWEKKDDIAKEAAELLSQGNIIAWMQGGFEFGPRALGARSVLADPRSDKMKDTINIKVKFREPFRPFCPSILEGYPEKIFEHYLSSPYMVMSFSVKPEWKEKLKAVVHVDGTVRPQEVFFRTNPIYAQLIQYFYEKTGVPAVLNTSQNVKGEPIVDTPAQAINFFKKTDVDFLVIGSYLVRK